MYIGSRNTLDADLVKPVHIPFKAIFTGKLRRYFSWQNFIDPFFVLLGFFQSCFIILRFRPHVVFAKGGFVSVPVVLAAWLFRRPIILHESDSVMGLANRITSKLATKICVTFEGIMQKDNRYILTGNPIRTNILNGDKQKGYQLTNFNKKHPIILVWGGSQGAQKINEMIERDFNKLKNHFQIIHVTGVGKKTKINNSAYCAFEYLDEELKHIYAVTDFIVGRAGANSLFEIALIQKPNIVIPLKNADQQANAQYFEQKGASIILKDNDQLVNILTDLWQNSHKQNEMKKALNQIAKPDAAEHIAKLILNFI